jgi:hypothetical protein
MGYYPSTQFYSPLHKNCVHEYSINPLQMGTVMHLDKYSSIMHMKGINISCFAFRLVLNNKFKKNDVSADYVKIHDAIQQ